ncbi:MAG: hypothetical protein OEU26_03830, partial [Candidatus Tectomicrobia bacterium]|nr:hypothetical protein [Candidatus Tectomicrobia bacterium]
MSTSEVTVGCSAILRVSGCPIQFWLAAANPELFACVRQLNRKQEQYRTLGVHLADRIGAELVPHPMLSRHDRALALRLRRQLHNGVPVLPTECRQLGDLARRAIAQSRRLIDELEQAARYAEELPTLETEATQAVLQEQARLPRLTWELIHTSPVTEIMLRSRNPEVYLAMEKRVHRGDSWESKDLRRRSDYVWQMIDRAATRSTPRDWHGHVALLLDCPGASALYSLAITAEFATEWLENIHSQRRALSDRSLEQADLETRFTFTPLSKRENGHLQFWVVDPNDPTQLFELRMRQTSLLDAIYTSVRLEPMTRDELEAEILPVPDEQQREVLRKFIEHLIGLGVLQVSSPPRRQLESWHSAAIGSMGERKSHTDHASSTCPAVKAVATYVKLPMLGPDGRDGYLDVYRRAATALSVSDSMRLQRLVQQALRVLVLIADDSATAAGALPVTVDERPRSVLEILRERVEAGEASHAHRLQPSGWPLATASGSPYARLLEWMAAQADESTVLDVNQMLLDKLGAPEGAINWPIDCVLRIPCHGAGFEAVLDGIFIAGLMDARFITALRRLHGRIPHADAYHQFLERLEQESGTTFVEVLIPPLSEVAANAIRRPIYTRAWTGDADIYTYCNLDGSVPSYIPLDAITLRRTDRHFVAEANGHPIFPVYHATRLPLPPWNLLTEILLPATPLPMSWFQHPLHHLFDAFPGRNFMPRVTIDSDLVLSCAQWRLSLERLWDVNSSPTFLLIGVDKCNLLKMKGLLHLNLHPKTCKRLL